MLKKTPLKKAFLLLFIYINTVQTQYKEIALKTCQGWCLKKFPETKLFIDKDLPKYNSTQIFVDYKGLGEPRFVVRDFEDIDVRVLDISKQSRKIIRLILKKLGFVPVKELEVLEERKESGSSDSDEKEGCESGFKQSDL